MTLLWIALSGAVGALARVGLSTAVRRVVPASFPSGTLVVNLLGCFLMGLVVASLESRWRAQPELRLAITAGLLGAFTTYSAFAYETLELWRNGWQLRALLYVLLSIGLGLLGIALGLRVGARV